MRPRVLILSWEYPPIVEGGLARHVRKLAEGLVGAGLADVHVLTRGALGMPEHETCAGVRVHRVNLPAFSNDLEQFVAWVEGMNRDMLAFGSLLNTRLRFDLVHGHDWLVAKASAQLARRFGVPYVTTVHATEHGRHQGWVDKHPQSYIHGIERWMVRRADRVIACSTYMQGHCAEIFDVPEQELDVVPNGVDPADLVEHPDPVALRKRFAEPDDLLLLLCGRLVYEKGFQLVLEALPPIIRRQPNVRFVVAGTGTHEAELKQMARRLKLESHGTFVGWVDDVTLHGLYRAADLCIVPSIYEPFGLVALEAMAAGCACLVADTGGLAEVSPAAMRFPARDARALGRALGAALASEKRRALLKRHGAETAARYDWAEIARETAELYARTMGAGRSATALRPA